jgi:MFS transporter, YNFM family, putative membrane transport protein
MNRGSASDVAQLPLSDASDVFIRHGTPAFRRTNLALFAAGFATFGLLYCVQPLMPVFSHDYGVSAATSALSLSLTTGVLAVANR